ncbi:MAG TPA: MBL fold metallo-hydrolase [Cytophagales bacterium]|mgnify:CR=1 FL=1|nr:MBL fold metallo-hydrolase [Cytophagales bacterium]
MYQLSEITDNVYRISIYVKDFNLQFNHFLIKDDEPMLYHAGLQQTFPVLLEAVSKLIDPRLLRWIGFSHFEVDECGALNKWLEIAPHARPVCSDIGALVNMSDFAIRPAVGLAHRETFSTGKFKFQFFKTPHLPHGWDAGVLFEQHNRTLFCSDLFFHHGNVEPLTNNDILGIHQASLEQQQAGPLIDYSPYSDKTLPMLQELSGLEPTLLATMHGSSYNGDCKQMLLDLDSIMRSTLSQPSIL